MVYVTPTEGMIVRPGQHVGGEGKVYHHFLAHWREAWDVSTPQKSRGTQWLILQNREPQSWSFSIY